MWLFLKWLDSRYDLGPPIFLGLVGCFLIFLGAVLYAVTVCYVLRHERYLHWPTFWRWLFKSVNFFGLFVVSQSGRICKWWRHVHVPSHQGPVHRILQTIQTVRNLHGLKILQQLQDLKDFPDNSDKSVRERRICVVPKCKSSFQGDGRSLFRRFRTAELNPSHHTTVCTVWIHCYFCE